MAVYDINNIKFIVSTELMLSLDNNNINSQGLTMKKIKPKLYYFLQFFFYLHSLDF